MNKTQRLLFFAALNIVISPTAFAKADHFPYFGAKVGYNLLTGNCFENYTECDDNSIGYGIFAGYQFNRWLGAEIDAVDYGNYDAMYQTYGIEDDIRGYGASLKLSMPVWDRAEAYLRAGGVFMNLNRAVDSVSDWSPAGALGLAYKLKPSWILRTEYQYIAEIEDRAGHFASLGLSYRFGQTEVSIKSVSNEMIEVPVPPKPKKEAIVPLEFRAEDVLKSEQLFFSLNSSILTPKAKSELKQIADLIRNKPGSNVWIQGYTDNTGAAKYNQWLSKRRAKAVGDYLVNLGLNNIYTKGKGVASSAAPKVANADDRKVIVTVTKPNEELEGF